MRRWIAYTAVGTAIELYAIRNKQADRTLSFATRTLFRTSSPAGQKVFMAFWTLLSAWFVPHVLRSNKR